MKRSTQFAAYAAVLISGVAVPLFASKALAQTSPDAAVKQQGPPPGQGLPPGQFGGRPGQAGAPAQAGPRNFQGQGMPMQPMGQGFPQMGGMQATMVVDGNFLYILQGNRLFKVDKQSLKTVAQGELPRPQMQRPDGGQPTRGDAPPPTK